MGLLRIRLLGGFEAVRDGEVPQPVAHWPRPGARTLVKLLAVTPGHQLHREDVMAVCWPHAELSAALRSLRVALHAARHALEPELAPRATSSYLVTDGPLLRFAHDAVQVDVDEAERLARRTLEAGEVQALRAAARACAGDVLPEDRYAAWAEPCRERVAGLRGQVAAALAARTGGAEHRADDTAHIRLDWALALDRSGRYAEAVRVLREALDLYVERGRRDDCVRVAARLAEALARTGGEGPARAVTVLRRHAPEARTPPLARAAHHMAAARVLSYTGDYAQGLASAREAERCADQAAPQPAEAGTGTGGGGEAVALRVRALAQQAVCSGLLGDVTHAGVVAERARELAEESGDTALLAHVLSVSRENARRTGRPREALRHGARALALAEQGGRPTATSFERANLAELHLMLGEQEEAGRLARAAVAVAEPFGGTALAFALAALASVRAQAADGQGPAALLDRAERCARDGGHLQALEKVHAVRAACGIPAADPA
ncbi:hypothetical protein [Streptomyces sp. NPDC088348]|uniref:AfsR/SARP family transcriptional regulator n=1 Tax=Streptomyces sp. NPDC088348 TaxID=3365853 RepID=UPI00382876B6